MVAYGNHFPKKFPEKICDRNSDILLAVSDFSANNLIKERKKGQIVNVGNTIIESAQITYNKAKKKV